MEVFRALGTLAETPDTSHVELCSLLELGEPPTAAEYSQTFVFELYPYGSIYLGHEGKLGGDARDRIAGFWRALSLTPPAEPDHLTVMLAFYAEVCEHKQRATPGLERDRWEHIRKSFLSEHLLSWLPIYLLRISEVQSPFYRKWGVLLSQSLVEEARTTGGEENLSAHLRHALPIADPRDGAPQDFLESLLAPARTGFILLRSDLVRAARELSLATRMGERRFVLETLLSQAPTEVLLWLAEFSKTSAAKYRNVGSTYSEIMSSWIRRAQGSYRLLRELAEGSDTSTTSET